MLVNTALKFKYVNLTFNFSFPAGIIDSCVEQMKQSHSQLQLESVRPGKASRTKKVSTDFQEMFCFFCFCAACVLSRYECFLLF